MKDLHKAINDSLPSLVAFGAVGRQNFAEVKLTVDMLSKEYDGKINFVLMDVSFDKPLKERYHIVEYPTWIIFKNGDEVWRAIGMQDIKQLKAAIDRTV